MNIIDLKLKKYFFKYIFQCLLATFVLSVAMLFLNIVTETALIASLGATAFIVFAMPKTYSSAPRRLIGGYTVGISIGIIFFYLENRIHYLSIIEPQINHPLSYVLAAIAVGLTIFIMTVTNTEHAPAAGISLGLVINQWDITSLLFIITSMLVMVGVKCLLKPYLINLSSPSTHDQLFPENPD